MRNRLKIILAVLLLAVSICGCARTESNETEGMRTAFINSEQYGMIKVNIWTEDSSPYDYINSIEESNKIMEAYLGDDYHEGEVIPITISEMYDYPMYPKGLQFGGKIFLNIDNSDYNGDDTDMIITMVHEQLHINGSFHSFSLSEEENGMLEEYVVYRLTKVVCCAYDEEKFSNAQYGSGPDLDLYDYLNELYEVFLGNHKASKELKTAVENAFE